MVHMEENYYYSGWPLCNYSAPNSDQSPPPFFSLPTTTEMIPLASSDSTSLQFGDYPSWPIPIEVGSEERAASASKSHSQAEKRRRDRINAQLATLRKLIPKSDKMDKAALLGSVVDHVKALKRKAMDVSKSSNVPTEMDEVTIEYHQQAKDKDEKMLKESIIIKASVCCDDRPELFPEIIQVLKGLRLTAVKADIVSVGGRIKSILVLCSSKNSEEEEEGSVCLSTIKQCLKSAVNKIASLSVASNCPARSKRQRFFLPSHRVQ